MESVRPRCDSRVTLLGRGVGGSTPPEFTALLDRLALPTCACDRFDVREYAQVEARDRVLAAALACFSEVGLAAPVPYGVRGSIPFEAAALELVHRLNAAVAVEGHDAWDKATQFLGAAVV